jgi:N-acetylneuraminic acid mutarotase
MSKRTKTLHALLIAFLLIVGLGTAPAQPIQAEPASYAAAASPRAWEALPQGGLNNRVRAFALMGSDLYVGGLFTQAYGAGLTDLGHVARYDTVSDTWHALPKQGLSHEVKALAVVGSDLYVGGIFTQTVDGTVSLGHIARYDTTNGTWHALPNQGLDDSVGAMAVVGGDLYVGGRFQQTGDGSLTNLGYIARYDTGAGTWHALPNQGLWGHIYAMAADGSDVYVGGGFTQTTDGAVDLSRIARYDTTTSTWHALPNQGLDDAAIALHASGGDLYVGGHFGQTGDGTLDLGHIARYDTTNTTWHALPNQGMGDSVSVLMVTGSDLYVGGHFSQTGDGALTNLGHMARYDTGAGTWHALPNQGVSAWVYALALVSSDLYVGGHFSQTGDGSLTLGRIARYKELERDVYLPLVVRNVSMP